MLNIDQTRERFTAWIKSPAFTRQVNARFKTPKWPFIVAGISLAATFLAEESRLFDTLLLVDDLPSEGLNDPLIPCMASPGPAGTIIQLPQAVAVFKDKPYDLFNPRRPPVA